MQNNPDDAALLDFLEEVSGEVQARVEEHLGSGFVRLRSSEAERRQALHDIRSVEDIVIELLRNARDAGASNIYIATTRDGNDRLLTVIDDGAGIPPEMTERVFEPRVTSKLDTMVSDDWGIHGRGMALYSIRMNTAVARVAQSAPGLGSALEVRTDTNALPEKADQSSLPVVEKDESGQLYIARGPHNIARTAVAFALAHRFSLTVYLGSPSEIAATLLEVGSKALTSEELLLRRDPQKLPLFERLALSNDAAALEQSSAELGLPISERTAHRILSGRIAALAPLLDSVLPRRLSAHVAPDLLRDNRGLKLAEEDLQAFSRDLEKIFEPLAERYYLSLRDVPRVRVKGDRITVRFDIEKEL
jgi:anti-sigma regulatory factor (Ser/Thr protein kinase)